MQVRDKNKQNHPKSNKKMQLSHWWYRFYNSNSFLFMTISCQCVSVTRYIFIHNDDPQVKV